MPVHTPVPTFHHDVYDAINPTNPSLSATGKVVLITGGGSGIGAATAKAFSLADASNIVLLGRRPKPLAETKAAIEALPHNKSKISTYEADITDKARIDAAFADVASKIGTIDIYIANAGYLAPPAPLAVAPVDEFEKAVSINITGNLIAAQAFLKHKSATSTLVAINTAAAHIYYMGPMSSYVASKAGAARLMDQLAAEHPDVRVFNLHPGLINSDMSEKAGMAKIADDAPELPAAFSVWLSAPEADFLRGRFVHSNWDVEELKAMKEEIATTDGFLQFNLVGFPFRYAVKAPWE